MSEDKLNVIIDLVKNMGTVLVIAFYAAVVIWTYKDARKRTEDPILVASFTAISMLPLFGVFIYMLVRPSEYLADVRERELEIRALESQLGRQERCPYCKSHIEGDYLSCPVCATKLRQTCSTCDKPLDPRWVLCPFCETEVPGRSRSKQPSSGGRMSVPARGETSRSDAPRREPRSAGREGRDARDTREARDSRSSRSAEPGSAGTGASSKRAKSATVEPEPIKTEPLDPV